VVHPRATPDLAIEKFPSVMSLEALLCSLHVDMMYISDGGSICYEPFFFFFSFFLSSPENYNVVLLVVSISTLLFILLFFLFLVLTFLEEFYLFLISSLNSDLPNIVFWSNLILIVLISIFFCSFYKSFIFNMLILNLIFFKKIGPFIKLILFFNFTLQLNIKFILYFNFDLNFFNC